MVTISWWRPSRIGSNMHPNRSHTYNRACGSMAERLPTEQKVPGSTPGTLDPFFHFSSPLCIALETSIICKAFNTVSSSPGTSSQFQ